MQINILYGGVPDLWLANISALFFYLLCFACLFRPVRKYLGPRLQPPTPSTGLYMEPLDSLRGLAALWIAAGHSMYRTYPFFSETLDYAPLLRVGSKSIAIFCVLSGLLIWLSVKRMKSLESLADYLKRRVLRIYPLYFATLTIVVLINIVPHEPARLIVEYLMLRSFMPTQTILLPHIWSLYVEVIYYALAPLMVLMFGRRALPIAILLTVVFFIAGPFGAREIKIVPYFFVGIALAEILDQYGNRIPRWAGIASFIIGALLFWVDISHDWVATLLQFKPNVSGFSVGLALACFFIIIGLTIIKPFAYLFGLSPLRILGTVSYSVFMLHPIFLYFCFPPQGLGENVDGRALLRETLPAVSALYLPFVFLPGIIFWSVISYILIERPFLKMRKKRGEALPADNVAP